MKNRKGEVNGMAILLGLIIVVLVALALIGSMANTTHTQTSKLTMTNDSITYSGLSGSGQINTSLQFNVTKNQGDWRTTECPISSYSFTNSSGTAYTETTDYVFTDDYGNFTLKNTAKVNASMASDNKTYVSYTYCDTGYLTSSGDRSLLSLVVTIMVIFLIVSVIVGVSLLLKGSK